MSWFAVEWIFELRDDYIVDIRPHLPADFSIPCAFEDRKGRRWLEIRLDGTARILAPYAWDGCTPKFSFFDIVFGIPDGVPNQLTRQPKAYYASLVHDALYQFLDAGLPLKRSAADRIFLQLLERDGFAPRWIYYAAVRVFGGIFHAFTRWKREYVGGRRTAL